jgi:hypothetical protein
MPPVVHIDARIAPNVGWAKQVRPAIVAGALEVGLPSDNCRRDLFGHLLRPYIIDANVDIVVAVEATACRNGPALPPFLLLHFSPFELCEVLH